MSLPFYQFLSPVKASERGIDHLDTIYDCFNEVFIADSLSHDLLPPSFLCSPGVSPISGNCGFRGRLDHSLLVAFRAMSATLQSPAVIATLRQ